MTRACLLASRLRTALDATAPLDLLIGDLDDDTGSEAHEAAVLVAITDRPEPGILFTVRREDMRTHAGQVAFPGGRIDPQDEDAASAALREAWEELGLDPDQVTLCGTADRYRTVTGFAVTPVVGVIPPDLLLAPHEDEVADWFEAPLAFVLDPANQKRVAAEFRGRTRHYFQIDWNGRKIWGATAAMLVNLSRRLKW
jgi:8-oxo-dGTP pyrophosphatase MutT (NUDIX family)